jgi:hypothetical protein
MSKSARGVGLHDEGAVGANQRGMRQRAAHRLLRHQTRGSRAVEIVELRLMSRIVRHRQRRSLQIAGVFLDIGLGDRQRRVDDRLGADLEPAVEPDVRA